MQSGWVETQSPLLPVNNLNRSASYTITRNQHWFRPGAQPSGCWAVHTRSNSTFTHSVQFLVILLGSVRADVLEIQSCKQDADLYAHRWLRKIPRGLVDGASTTAKQTTGWYMCSRDRLLLIMWGWAPGGVVHLSAVWCLPLQSLRRVPAARCRLLFSVLSLLISLLLFGFFHLSLFWYLSIFFSLSLTSRPRLVLFIDLIGNELYWRVLANHIITSH